MALMAVPALGNHPGDRDCPDFDSHEQAQAFFDRHGGSASENVDRLDGDSDGLACEDYEYSGSRSGGGDNDNDEGGQQSDGDDPGELPESSTTPVGSGAPLSLLLTVLGLGTFGLMLRRRIGLRV